MNFYYRAAYRQTHPHSSVLRSIERLKQALETLRAHPWAGILHRHQDTACFPPSADEQLSCPFSQAALRLEGIDDQVQDDLLQLHTVSLNARQLLGELRLYRDRVLLELAMGQNYDLPHRFIDIDRVLPQRRLSEHDTDPPDDLGGPPPLLDNVIQGLSNLIQIRRLRAQPALSRIGIVDCRCNRLHDLVSNRGRQLPHCRDAIEVRELRLRFAQRPRGLPQFARPFLGSVRLRAEKGRGLFPGGLKNTRGGGSRINRDRSLCGHLRQRVTDRSNEPSQRRPGGMPGHLRPERPVTIAGIRTMATGKKKAAPKRSMGSERTVVYRGIKILPIYGRPSATARAFRDALRMKSK